MLQPAKLPIGRKISPLDYLNAGWISSEETAIWRWINSCKATIAFTAPSTEIRYFMVEVSALSENQSSHPQSINISINGAQAEEWIIDSTTIHDKLLIIPEESARDDGALFVTLSLQHAKDQMSSSDSGLAIHSISLDTNLDAYLNELQTGYNWACGLRNELIDTIHQTLDFLKYNSNHPRSLTAPLEAVIQNPYVVSEHEAKLTFDEKYFHANFNQLKNGYVHQAIRQWAIGTKILLAAIINAGNYATKQPNIPCWDPKELEAMLPPPLHFTDKVAQLRTKNITLNNLEILLHKDQIDSVPPLLYLDITNRCNFRCRMCYQSTSHFLRQNLINEHLAVIIDMLPYLTEITVAGLGEPLLSKNLLTLAKRAHLLHCPITVITNGSLIGANIDLLKNFSTVSISFDGAEATTFETLRDRSNFSQIINNIKKLRQEAPEISLAFSVVLSRANLDELSAIIQWASDLGINIVNVSPLEHMPDFELKLSDLPLYQVQQAAAVRIAKKAGITLCLAIDNQNFSKTNDTPRNKKAILDKFSVMSPATEPALQLETITQQLQTAPFRYYPPTLVYPSATHLQVEDQAPLKHDTKTIRREFNFDKEINRLDQKIASCLNELKDTTHQLFLPPYCLDPWKLNYVKSNGKSRLCCHTDHIVGDLGSHGYQNALGSQEYLNIRQSMAGKKPLLAACKQCKAADRFLGMESISETCKLYGFPFSTVINA